jgi:hypothetical protein
MGKCYVLSRYENIDNIDDVESVKSIESIDSIESIGSFKTQLPLSTASQLAL